MIETLFSKIIALFFNLGPAALVLGFLIFVHELGHFMAARFVGIRVEVFSIGFGKRLLGFRRGATDYRLSLIPFGGYVRMAGEEMPGQSEGSEDLSEVERLSAEHAEPGDTLNEKPVPSRLLVAVAGAGMNAIIAVLLTIGLAYFGIMVDSYLLEKPVVDYVQLESPAGKAGIQPGDTILTIDGDIMNNWEDAQQAIALNMDKETEITINRNSETLNLNMLVDQNWVLYAGGVSAFSKVIVGKVSPDSPAKNAGLQTGDQIVSINGNTLSNYLEMTDIISQSQGNPVELKVLRKDETLRFSMTPELNSEINRYLIGIGFANNPDRVLRRYPFSEAVSKGIQLNYQMGKLMFTVFQRLITGRESVRNLGGPVMIVDMAGKAAEAGVRELIWLTALISLNLAILNLLPLPILDGGLVVFLLIEWIIRRPVSEKVQIALQNVFFILLISFALYITYIDFLRIDILSWFK